MPDQTSPTVTIAGKTYPIGRLKMGLFRKNPAARQAMETRPTTERIDLAFMDAALLLARESIVQGMADQGRAHEAPTLDMLQAEVDEMNPIDALGCVADAFTKVLEVSGFRRREGQQPGEADAEAAGSPTPDSATPTG